jgi:hypothetical protein
MFPLELTNLFSQAILVVDNAKAPITSATKAAEQLPALIPYKKASQRATSSCADRRRSHHVSNVSRWESTPSTTKHQEKPVCIPVRKECTLDSNAQEILPYVFSRKTCRSSLDSVPRMPRRSNSIFCTSQAKTNHPDSLSPVYYTLERKPLLLTSSNCTTAAACDQLLVLTNC